MEKLRIGCVVMAAGNASRFGENKLSARVDGKPLLIHALEAVPTDRFCRVVVVTQYPEAAEAAGAARESVRVRARSKAARRRKCRIGGPSLRGAGSGAG